MAEPAGELNPQRQALLAHLARPRRLLQARRLLGGYDDLRPRATLQAVAGTTIGLPIASLADIEHSRRTAARPEDANHHVQL